MALTEHSKISIAFALAIGSGIWYFHTEGIDAISKLRKEELEPVRSSIIEQGKQAAVIAVEVKGMADSFSEMKASIDKIGDKLDGNIVRVLQTTSEVGELRALVSQHEERLKVLESKARDSKDHN